MRKGLPPVSILCSKEKRSHHNLVYELINLKYLPCSIVAREAPYAKARTHFARDVQMTKHHRPHDQVRSHTLIMDPT